MSVWDDGGHPVEQCENEQCVADAVETVMFMGDVRHLCAMHAKIRRDAIAVVMEAARARLTP